MKDLSDFTPRPRPGTAVLTGEHVRLEPYDAARHGQGLADCLVADTSGETWRYMPFDFSDPATFPEEFANRVSTQGWAAYTILDRQTSEPLGTASYMRQRPEHGSVEVGCVAFSPALRKRPAASEAIYLMAAHVLDDLGYRRFEWKCNNANQASRRAAVRFGFRFEGIFRNDMVAKGENRDTAWYAMTDDDWPGVKIAFQRWLSPSNFDAAGQQLMSLSVLQAAQARIAPAHQHQQDQQ